ATADCEDVEQRIASGEAARHADRAALADVEGHLSELRKALEHTHREREACLREHGALRERLAVLGSQREGLLARASRSIERVSRLSAELAAAPAADGGNEPAAVAELTRYQREQEQLEARLGDERRGSERARQQRSELVRRQQTIVAEAEAGR